MPDQDEQQIAAFSHLAMDSRSRIFGFIYSMLHNVADAEDVYQQTMIVMWEKFDEFRPGTNFVNWALAIAQFKVKQFCSKAARQRVWFDDSIVGLVAESYCDMGSGLASSDHMDGLLHCLERLPEKQRRLLKARYGDGLTIRELAQRESKAEAAVAMVLARLRKSLLLCITSALGQRQVDA